MAHVADEPEVIPEFAGEPSNRICSSPDQNALCAIPCGVLDFVNSLATSVVGNQIVRPCNPAAP